MATVGPGVTGLDMADSAVSLPAAPTPCTVNVYVTPLVSPPKTCVVAVELNTNSPFTDSPVPRRHRITRDRNRFGQRRLPRHHPATITSLSTALHF